MSLLLFSYCPPHQTASVLRKHPAPPRTHPARHLLFFRLQGMIPPAAPSFDLLSALVERLGVRPTCQALGISNNTLHVRLKEPSGCSLRELLAVATLADSTLPAVVEALTATPSPVPPSQPRPVAAPATLPYASLAELIHAQGGRYETAKTLGLSPNTLAVRMRKPESFTLAELQAVAKLANVDLFLVVELALRQIEQQLAPPEPTLGRPSFRKR